MPTQPEMLAFAAGIVAAMPSLARYAQSLCRSADDAEDLVQETLLKAWSHRGGYEPGSNLKAWLFTILRNTFLNGIRKKKREVQDVDGIYSARLRTDPAHHASLDLSDFLVAFAQVPAPQRKALVLVGALGHSYDEAALLAGTAPGTIKSRVSRARQYLMRAMQVQGAMDFASAPPATAATPHYACA
jgi:RNA polymerase sigma-70 factor (ECF subfamily)